MNQNLKMHVEGRPDVIDLGIWCVMWDKLMSEDDSGVLLSHINVIQCVSSTECTERDMS